MSTLRHTAHDLMVLLRLRVRLLLREQRGSGNEGWSRNGRLLLAAIGVTSIVIFLSIPLTRALQGAIDVPAGRSLLRPLLSWGASWAALFQFLFAIPVVLGALTHESDLRLLLLTPLSPRLIMTEKLVSLFGGSALLLLGLGGVVLFNAGQALDLNPGFYLAAVLVLLLLPIGPMALALLLVQVVLRWVPPARARNAASILGALLGIATYLGIQTLSRRGAETGDSLRATLEGNATAWWRVLPIAWPGEGLAAIGLGQLGAGLAYLGAFALLTLAMASLAVVLSAHLFSTGWATYLEVGRRSRDRDRQHASSGRAAGVPERRSAPARTTKGERRWRPVWWPLVGKEWRTLRRDPQIWTGILYPLFFLGFWTVQNVSDAARFSTSGRDVIAASVYFGTLFFMVDLMISTLTLPVVNREARALYLLALSPLSPRDIFLGKWLFCVAPVLLLAEVIIIGGGVLISIRPLYLTLAVVSLACLVFALTAALLLITLTWPKLDWDNPQRSRSRSAGLIGSVVGLGLSSAIFGLMILTIWLIERLPLAAIASGGMLFALTGLVILVSLRAGPARLQRLLISDV